MATAPKSTPAKTEPAPIVKAEPAPIVKTDTTPTEAGHVPPKVDPFGDPAPAKAAPAAFDDPANLPTRGGPDDPGDRPYDADPAPGHAEPEEAYEKPARAKAGPGLPAASDATPEELDTVTMTGVSLAQLRAIRARDNIDADAIVAHRDTGKDPRADICGACFPQGWPNAHADHAECEHGTWDR